MGSGFCKPCYNCCGKIQNYCRDSCGCCPCNCCKTVTVELKASETVHHRVDRRDTPFGYALLHAGIRTAENKNTSPVIEVHTWRKSMIHSRTREAAISQRVALGGMQTERDNADRHLGPSRGAEERKLEIDEDIIIIPIESIISIKSSSEIKKGETEHRHVRLRTPPPPIDLSCCQKVNRWCKTTFCCCCDDSNKIVHHEPEQIMKTVGDQQAERKILISIEHIRYSNINTPSHIQVLSSADQGAFYKENLHKDTLKFYLLDNREFDQADFDLKRTQAATLCRLITQLKTMGGHYPDKQTLEQIIGHKDNLTIGEPPKENLQSLTGSGKIEQPK